MFGLRDVAAWLEYCDDGQNDSYLKIGLRSRFAAFDPSAMRLINEPVNEFIFEKRR